MSASRQVSLSRSVSVPRKHFSVNRVQQRLSQEGPVRLCVAANWLHTSLFPTPQECNEIHAFLLKHFPVAEMSLINCGIFLSEPRLASGTSQFVHRKGLSLFDYVLNVYGFACNSLISVIVAQNCFYAVETIIIYPQ